MTWYLSTTRLRTHTYSSTPWSSWICMLTTSKRQPPQQPQELLPDKPLTRMSFSDKLWSGYIRWRLNFATSVRFDDGSRIRLTTCTKKGSNWLALPNSWLTTSSTSHYRRHPHKLMSTWTLVRPIFLAQDSTMPRWEASRQASTRPSFRHPRHQHQWRQWHNTAR